MNTPQPHHAYVEDVVRALEGHRITPQNAWAQANRGNPQAFIHIRPGTLGQAARNRWPFGVILKWDATLGWRYRSYFDLDDRPAEDHPLVTIVAAPPVLVADAARVALSGNVNLLPFTEIDNTAPDWTGRTTLEAAVTSASTQARTRKHIATRAYSNGTSSLSCKCGQWKSDRTRPAREQRLAHQAHRAAMGEYVQPPAATTAERLAAARTAITAAAALLTDDTPGAVVPAAALRAALALATPRDQAPPHGSIHGVSP
ncbi:hypothetical protein [Embleya sp. NPDC059237]|uniref:hypothetical protein n=1 Tax=Embleya sp. NPDC059237 TaxID=3346784 RepID=UPI0036CCBE99